MFYFHLCVDDFICFKSVFDYQSELTAGDILRKEVDKRMLFFNVVWGKIPFQIKSTFKL